MGSLTVTVANVVVKSETDVILLTIHGPSSAAQPSALVVDFNADKVAGFVERHFGSRFAVVT